MSVRRLDHAVLYVRDADTSSAFYQSVLGLELVEQIPKVMVFLRSPGSDAHHELGLFTHPNLSDAPPAAAPPRSGLYHLAWQVDTLDDLAETHDRLQQARALRGASDHGVSKSLYAADPDGLEFEVLWQVPRDLWPTSNGPIAPRPLDLTAELAAQAASHRSGPTPAPKDPERLGRAAQPPRDRTRT